VIAARPDGLAPASTSASAARGLTCELEAGLDSEDRIGMPVMQQQAVWASGCSVRIIVDAAPGIHALPCWLADLEERRTYA